MFSKHKIKNFKRKRKRRFLRRLINIKYARKYKYEINLL